MKTRTINGPKRSNDNGYRANVNARTTSSSPPSPSGSEPLARLESLVRGLVGTGKGLGISFIFQDEETRQWAKEAYRKIVKLAGAEGLRPSWWRIEDLSVPGILAGAVSTAVRADIIVVATREEGLPLPFYVWVNMWWPHKSHTSGGLLALIGTNGAVLSRGGRVGKYLREVSQQARLEFFLLERPLTPATKTRIGPANRPVKALNGQPLPLSKVAALPHR
jgi:hypothetical protein